MKRFRVKMAVALETDNFSMNLASGGVKTWDEYVHAEKYEVKDGALIFKKTTRNWGTTGSVETVATFAPGRWVKVEEA